MSTNFKGINQDLKKLKKLLRPFTNSNDITTYKLPKQSNKVEVSLVTITPTLAENLLNNHNDYVRDFKSPSIKTLTASMSSNKWQFNGKPIRFDNNGMLVDGIHRLKSIVNSGIVTNFIVVTGLNENTFNTIDVGKSRCNSDILKVSGVNNSKLVSSTIRHLFRYEINKNKINNNNDNSNKKYLGYSTITNINIMELYNSFEGLETSIEYTNSIEKDFKEFKLNRPLFTALHYLCSKTNKEDADYFFKVLRSGHPTNPNRDVPIITLRNILINDKMDKSNNLSTNDIFKYCSVAWINYLQHKNIKKIKLKDEYNSIF